MCRSAKRSSLAGETAVLCLVIHVIIRSERTPGFTWWRRQRSGVTVEAAIGMTEEDRSPKTGSTFFIR